ncbi:MAG: glycosyltransferase [Gammaproteobacteria bacterium]|nr:glycosyltransferase [Gammaproteobacteria bacterium]
MRISVVILNWNGGAANCIEAVQSALEQDYFDKEVIFVDNGSTDNSGSETARAFPDVNFIFLEANTGVSHGRNVGAAAASGSLVFFLENDGAWQSTSVISDAVRLFESLPDLGAIYTKVVGYDSGKVDAPIDFHGGISDDGIYYASSFRGGASVIKRETYLSLGGFPDDYFRQGEERFLSLRMYEAGFRVAYWPRHTMRHKGSDYTGKRDTVQRFSCENELKTVVRLYPNPIFIGVLLYKLFAWGIRFARAGRIAIFRKILSCIPAWLAERRTMTQVSFDTIRLVEGLQFSGAGTWRLQDKTLSEMKSLTGKMNPLVTRLTFKMRKWL